MDLDPEQGLGSEIFLVKRDGLWESSVNWGECSPLEWFGNGNRIQREKPSGSRASEEGEWIVGSGNVRDYRDGSRNCLAT